MKTLKILGLTAVAAMAMMAFGAANASATTLEESGTTKNGEVTISASLVSGSKVLLKDTVGIAKNECSTSDLHGRTTFFTGTSVTGPLTEHGGSNPEAGLSFTNCVRGWLVLDPGTFEITWTSGTNGSVALENGEMKVGTAVGIVTCKFGETTKIGTFTGVATGNATLDVNAVLNCGIIPTAQMEATYEVTSTGIGVSQ